ncbi:peptidase S58 family protein [Microlunatus sp. Gsoil 973]|nr:peptidase S58 family protein [Microlunatus sp. Gsoil 973]
MDNASHGGSITDVTGIRVGQVHRSDGGYLTGVTVVLPPHGTVGGVDVRGGGPGTHETDALKPGTLVSTVDAVTLTGGSAYGLIAAHGAQRWCEDHRRGLPLGRQDRVVPIVPAAAVFDLGRGGEFTARPEEDWGYRAAELADGSGDHAAVQRGNVGAGAGSLVAGRRLKGGVGTASLTVSVPPADGEPAAGAAVYTVGALAVVNARGVPVLPGIDDLLRELEPGAPDGLNTTIAVVATDAALDVADTTRMAACGHDGLARCLDPVHTLYDGDTIFGLATGEYPLPTDPAGRIAVLVELQAAAATVISRAVLDGVGNAATVATPAGTFTGLGSLPCRAADHDHRS